ncbi:MAG TPA: hypothetical protein DCO77_02935 [Nitrospiraceae bacterium]|nr:hypothetical protein [Nitrospiraceae bacterium]
MEPDILNSVIEAEQQIQERLEKEKNAADLRIEQARSEADQEIAGEEERLKQEAERVGADAKAGTDEQVADIIRSAENAAAARSRIPEETLHAVVERHLAGILPKERQ